MKRMVCTVFAFLFLFTFASAYNGDTIVYVTNSGSKYHQEWCSYLKSSNAISLENAVNQGYTPCSRCNPPYLDISATSSGGTFVRITPDVPTPESRYAQLKREMDEQKITELEGKLRENQLQLDIARTRLKTANVNLKNVKEQLQQAQENVKTAQNELQNLKGKLRLWGICGVLVGVPVMILFVWQLCWNRAKSQLDRLVESEVSKRLALQAAERPSFHAMPHPSQEPAIPPIPPKTQESVIPPKPSKPVIPPPPKPAKPTASPPPKTGHQPAEEEEPLFRVDEDNPYMTSAYKMRYEGKSLSKLAGVPDPFWFDDDAFPHMDPSLFEEDWTTVYISKGGTVYHRKNCQRMKNARPVNICFAKKIGRVPCRGCHPVDKLPEWVCEYQRLDQLRKRFNINMKP